VSFVESQRNTSEEVLRRLENSQHLQATQPDKEDDAQRSMQAAPAHGQDQTTTKRSGKTKDLQPFEGQM
jgi:hypothetical protein